MRPTRLTVRNFRALRQAEVEFADGIAAITGANGAGKSSILMAIDFALFGARGEAAGLVNRDGDGRMLVELEFTHGGETYLVRRQVTKGKTTVDLEVADTVIVGRNGWVPLTKETAAATQVAIETLLGFTRRTLRASSLLMQSDHGAFCNSDPRDRKSILGDALGLDRYACLHTAVRADVAAANADAQRLAGRAEALGDRAALEQTVSDQAAWLAEAQATVETATGELALAEQAAADAAAEWETLRAAATRLQTLQAEHRAAMERAESLRRVDLEAQAAREKADGVRARIATVEKLVDEHTAATARAVELEAQARRFVEQTQLRRRHLDDAERLERQRSDSSASAMAVARKLDALDQAERPTCDRCEQHLPDEARTVARASLVREYEQATKRVDELDRQYEQARHAADAVQIPGPVVGLAELRARIAETAGAPADLAGLRATLAGYDETIAKADSDGHRIALFEAAAMEASYVSELANLPAADPQAEARAQERALTAQATAARIRDTLAAVRQEIPVRQHQHDRAQATLAELDTLAQQQTELAVRARHLTLLERAYGPNGIPLLILENAAIPAIEHEANRVLSQLAGKPASEGWTVELRTQAQTVKGDLRDALDIIVHVPGGEAQYAQLSGSEQVKVALAIRLGVAALLANRRGADCQLLAIDEPEGLDDEGKPALVELVASLADRYSVVLIASHDPDLRDRFDHTIHVQDGSVDAQVDVGPPVGAAA